MREQKIIKIRAMGCEKTAKVKRQLNFLLMVTFEVQTVWSRGLELLDVLEQWMSFLIGL